MRTNALKTISNTLYVYDELWLHMLHVYEELSLLCINVKTWTLPCFRVKKYFVHRCFEIYFTIHYMYMMNSEYTSSMSMKRRRGVNLSMFACLPNPKVMARLKWLTATHWVDTGQDRVFFVHRQPIVTFKVRHLQSEIVIGNKQNTILIWLPAMLSIISSPHKRRSWRPRSKHWGWHRSGYCLYIDPT